MIEKVKLNEVAKDLNISGKDLTALLQQRFGGEAKKPQTVLSGEELNFVMEHYTQQHAVKDFGEYFKLGEKKPAPAAAPKPAEKPTEKPVEKAAPAPAPAQLLPRRVCDRGSHLLRRLRNHPKPGRHQGYHHVACLDHRNRRCGLFYLCLTFDQHSRSCQRRLLRSRRDRAHRDQHPRNLCRAGCSLPDGRSYRDLRSF